MQRFAVAENFALSKPQLQSVGDKMRPPRKLKIMVSSTVYGLQPLLDQVYAILDGYGYEVWMSHKGTVPVDPGKHNFENCLSAVETCDAFLGIITGRYGSGIAAGEPSITHQEMRHAIVREKMRWFLVHYDVTIARTLLRQFRFDEQGNPKPFVFRKTAVLDDIRVLEMYEEATRNDVPLSERVGNWVQSYHEAREVLTFLDAQFADTERLRKMMSRRTRRNPL